MNVPATVTVQNSAGTLEIDGNITSGTAELLTAGPGTVVLAGSDTISVNGAANVASFASNVLSTGTLTVSGGNFVLQPNATFTVAGGLVSASAAAGGVGTVIGNTAGGAGNMVVSGGTFAQTNALLYVGQHSTGALTITGAGVVALGASPLAFTYNRSGGTGILQLNGGTLQCSGFTTTTAGQTLNFNGGVLELTASTTNLFGTAQADFTSNVQNDMIVNLNGCSTTINDALLGSGSGGLTVTSLNGGSLTLTGTNTYTGGTYVRGRRPDRDQQRGHLRRDEPVRWQRQRTVAVWRRGLGRRCGHHGGFVGRWCSRRPGDNPRPGARHAGPAGRGGHLPAASSQARLVDLANPLSTDARSPKQPAV